MKINKKLKEGILEFFKKLFIGLFIVFIAYFSFFLFFVYSIDKKESMWGSEYDIKEKIGIIEYRIWQSDPSYYYFYDTLKNKMIGSHDPEYSKKGNYIYIQSNKNGSKKSFIRVNVLTGENNPRFVRVFLNRPSEQKNGKAQKASPNRVTLAMRSSEVC